MKPFRFALSLLPLALLSACREDLPPSAYIDRPELQDAQSRFILSQFGQDPRLIAALQEVYGEIPAPKAPPILLGPLNRLDYVKSVAWGSARDFQVVALRRELIETLHPGLDWETDGCSTPPGLDFGYNQTFRSACLVHDFGYHNLRVLERTAGNRDRTDLAFFSNMKAICNTQPPPQRPSCYLVAFMYEQAVRLGGVALF